LLRRKERDASRSPPISFTSRRALVQDDKQTAPLPKIPAKPSATLLPEGGASGFMNSTPLPHPQNASKPPCKHPRVQIVSRDEDAEFVECLECREVFESSELKDMSIEERAEREDETPSADGRLRS